MITDLEEALSVSREIKEMFGKGREVFISEFVFEEMLAGGAKKVQFNRIRFIDPKVDARGYKHIIRYKEFLYSWKSTKRID